MSTTAIYTTHCDAADSDPYLPDKADGCHWWVAEADSRAESRRRAGQEGWALGAKGVPDFCPACVPEGWCPTCGVSGRDAECTTSNGRDHRARTLTMIAAMRRREGLR